MIWGAAYSFNKIALERGSTLEVMLIQLSASVLFLLIVSLAVGKRWRDCRGALRFWWTGLLEPGATYLLGMLGLRDADAGVASIIISSEAVVALIMMALLGWVSPSRWFVLVAWVSSLGMYLAVGHNPGHMSAAHLFSYLCLLLSTLCAASYFLITAKMLDRDSPLIVALVQQAVALIALWLIFLLDPLGGHQAVIDLDTRTLLWIAICGVLQYGVAFALFLFALRYLTASSVGVYLNLTPVFGVAVGALVLGETLSIVQTVGCVIVITALFALSLDKDMARDR
jgi:drug/metabolite transporter (DMT)-like permease